MFDPLQITGWAVRGLQGVVNLLIDWDNQGVVLSEHFLLELEKEAEKISDLIESQRAKVR